jgi:hypothetical protein
MADQREWQTRLNGKPDISEQPLNLKHSLRHKYPSPFSDFISSPSPPHSNYLLLSDPSSNNNITNHAKSTPQVRSQVSPRPRRCKNVVKQRKEE